MTAEGRIQNLQVLHDLTLKKGVEGSAGAERLNTTEINMVVFRFQAESQR